MTTHIRLIVTLLFAVLASQTLYGGGLVMSCLWRFKNGIWQQWLWAIHSFLWGDPCF